jgi:hypothetical protein
MKLNSLIKIKRLKKFGDTLRFYEILLDGKNVEIIFASQNISIPVNPGNHVLRIAIDWGGSEEINFTIGEEEEIQFECESNFSLAQIILFPYYLIFGTNQWISFKKV